MVKVFKVNKMVIWSSEQERHGRVQMTNNILSENETSAATVFEAISVGDNNASDAHAYSIEAIIELRDHTFVDDARSLILFELVVSKSWDDRVVVVGIEQNARLLEAVNESYWARRSESACEFGCDSIGVGIEELSLSVVSDRRDDRDSTLFDE